MTLGDILTSIWQQVLAEGKSTVELEDKTYPVGTTRAKKLRTVRFDYSDYRLDGIEQNPANNLALGSLGSGWKAGDAVQLPASICCQCLRRKADAVSGLSRDATE